MNIKITTLILVLCGAECMYAQSQIKEMQTLFNLNSQTIEDTTVNIESFDSTRREQFKYWLTFGYWVFTEASINLSYSFSLAHNFYKIGYAIRGSQLGGTGKDGRLYYSLDYSIGKRVQSPWFSYAFFIGPSYLWGVRKNLNSDEHFTTVGLRGDLQLLFRPANEFGFGLGFYGNLNFEKCFVGVNIDLTIGNGK